MTEILTVLLSAKHGVESGIAHAYVYYWQRLHGWED